MGGVRAGWLVNSSSVLGGGRTSLTEQRIFPKPLCVFSIFFLFLTALTDWFSAEREREGASEGERVRERGDTIYPSIDLEGIKVSVNVCVCVLSHPLSVRLASDHQCDRLRAVTDVYRSLLNVC